MMKSFRSYLEKNGWLWLPVIPDKLTFKPMSVNDICVTMPAWFGSLSSIFGGLLAYEASRSVNAGIMGVGIMAVIPANLMRSVAGEFDNEAVAVTAILSTFWLWVRSVRNPSSWPWAILAAASYTFMVSAWGGYIFVINAIGVHALVLVGLGRFNFGVHKAYTLLYLLGTAGAVQIPVVGWTPLRSLEQIGPLGVFLGYQVLALCDYQRKKQLMSTKQFVMFRIKTFVALIVAIVGVSMLLAPMGYFGPLSSRIRGLFVKHTKTGNPLVDSVAEHQPADPEMYTAYLNLPLGYVLPGTLVCLYLRNNAAYFLAVYGAIAVHFSLKMSRLVLICGPIVSIVCAIWAGFLLDLLVEPVFLLLGKKYPEDVPAPERAPQDKAAKSKSQSSKGKTGKADPGSAKHAASQNNWELQEWDEDLRPGGMAHVKRAAKNMICNAIPDGIRETFRETKRKSRHHKMVIGSRLLFSILVILYFLYVGNLRNDVYTFLKYCDETATMMSNPTIMKPVQTRDGRTIIIDDALQGYNWLAKKTPKDSRVFAWWDYGYQITGIGKRTSLADGNTWNHEHIATIGRLLSGSQKSSHGVIRHLADYVLIMTGAVNDDLGISPHFARIGNSVFPDHCGDQDPYCEQYSFYGGDPNQPTKMMAKSLVYNLYQHGKGGKAKANPKLFELVYTSPYDQMRIFKVLNVSQESKDWVANPENKICDAPGSWYCVGQYPPAIAKFLQKRRSFAQVEDFNKKGEKSAYTKMIEKQKDDL